MANNYQQATVVPFLFPPPEALTLLSELRDIEDDNLSPELLEKIPEEWTTESAEEGARVLTEEMESAFRAIDFEPASREEGTYFFFEDFCPDEGAAVVQWLLRQCTKETPWATIEGAYTCSELRPGQFGGFAWFITRDSLDCSGTSHWISEQAKAFREARSAT